MVMMNSVEYYNAVQGRIEKQVKSNVYGTFDGIFDMFRFTYDEAIKQCGFSESCRNYWRMRREELTSKVSGP